MFHDGFNREAFGDLLAKHGFNDIQFVTAHTVNKPEKDYPIFLADATKGEASPAH